ncbi:MAG: sodium/proton-translocating pyrophosphatase [Planctomycetota bacterium]|nr:sodium/proton-translocating pyrophosphatase [Planctomycetota bacterium]
MQLPKEAMYALVAGAVGLIFAIITAKKVMRADRGNERMIEIQDAIAGGAMAFLRREYKALSIFVVAVALILAVALQGTIEGLGWKTAIAFVMGAICSSICGFGGMKIATAANARTTQAATRSFNEALGVAFPGGVVMGMLVMSVGILGLTGLFFLFTSMSGEGGIVDASIIMGGFSMGASSIALFARVGGGIYTKAADVGADLVGKVEAGIPEDDPRNPAVIADNVGDNVGDVAGMGADLFESYVGSILAAMTIAAGMAAMVATEGGFSSISDAPGVTTEELAMRATILPLVLAAIGIAASIVGTFFVSTDSEEHLSEALHKGLWRH